MSLLIKALQKAEQSKSEAVENAAVPSSPSATSELELAPHHENLSASLHEESGFDAVTPSQVAGSTQRQAAASSVLRAGQSKGSYVGTSSALMLAGGGLLLLMLSGGAFYYYLNSLEQPTLVMSRPISTQLPSQVQTPVIETVTPQPSVVVPVAQAETAIVPRDRAARTSKSSGNQPEVTRYDNVTVEQEAKNKTPSTPETTVKVTKNRVPVASVNDQVLSGYQAYVAGDDIAAARYYRQAAQTEPRNADVLLGLAAVAARQGKTEEAVAQYMRVLELEPRNASAQTGLIGLVGQLDPAASESRLKTLLAQQPDAAFLHAAMGNLYADQGQWPSAQQAYFQAYHFEPSNAEYAFNLAVSLDQMGKSDLALNHYQRALELLSKQGGTVDKSQLEARMTQLRQSLAK